MNRYFRKRSSDDAFYRSMANRPLPKNKTSRFRGVQKNNNPKKPYRVSFSFNRRRYYIGAFADELEAARAYNEAVLRVIGDESILNDLPPG
jgi:hypothetical protein